MNPMLLVLAMSTGQPPATEYPAIPTPAPRVIAAQGGAALPRTLPAFATQAPMQPGTTPMVPPAGASDNPPETPKEEEKKPETPPTVYLLEKSLRETWLGKTMADNNLKLYGWTAMNYTVSTTSNTNGPMTFNDRSNHFQLNQNWIHFEKTIDTTKKEFQWGFATDGIVPGTDYRYTLQRGLFDKQLTSNNGGPQPYGFDLYQAYAQVFLPNLGGEGTTVKIGRFATIIGYEVVQAVDTPFVSKAYLFQYNPFTHTGAFATTQLNDTWSIGNGLALGNDNFFNAATRLTYLGQIKWAPPEGKTSVSFNTTVTNPRFDAADNFAFYNVYNLQVIHKFNDKFTYVADSSFSHMDGVPGIGSATWYGMANYGIYKLSDKLTGTVRAEVFEDTKGARTGFKGLYTEATAGVAWSPLPAVIVRPSVRYDYNNQSRPFEGDHGMWTGALEMIFRW